MRKIKILTLVGLSSLVIFSCADNDLTVIDNTIESEANAPTEEFVAEEIAPVVIESTDDATEVLGDAEAGNAVFTEKACTVCHASDSKTVGPSLMDISKAYGGNNEGMVAFLKEEADAIVDPAMFAVMQANLAITKEMDDKALNDLVAFIMSH